MLGVPQYNKKTQFFLISIVANPISKRLVSTGLNIQEKTINEGDRPVVRQSRDALNLRRRSPIVCTMSVE